MILQKLSAILLLAGLVFQTIAFAAPIKAQSFKGGAVTQELKQNALQLLSSVSGETGQLKLAENRVRTRTIIADLIWKHDEQAARKLYQQAFTELRELFGQTDAARIERMSDNEKTEHYANRFRLGDLRREYILTLAAHDPALAIDALRALKTTKIAEWDPLAERFPELRLETAAGMAAKDPHRAYAIYAEEIAAGGMTLALIESFNELHRKNPELTASIAKIIFDIIKGAQIGEFSADKNTTKIAVTRSTPVKIEFWQVTAFLNAASKLKRRTEQHNQKTLPPPLAETELKELAKLLAGAFLSAPNPGKNVINQAMTAITRYAPEQVARIRQKVGAEGVRSYQTVMESDTYYLWLEEKDADGLALEADRAKDPDKRDLLYAEAARRSLAEEKAEKAKTIAARIKNREGYAALIEEIETAVPVAIARRGHPAEVRRLLRRLKTNGGRIAVLLEFASALAANGDHKTAKKTLDEALQEMIKHEPDETEAETSLRSRLETAGKFAAVSARIAPDEAFTNIEPIIQVVNAEIKRQNSSGNGSLKTTEFFYDAMDRELLLHTPQTVELLKNLARADFGRTVKLIDKFERPEIRLIARLRLAQSLLDPQAAEKEKEMLEQFLAEMDET